MRVIGGELKRRGLRAPAGAATRPSSERLRQALFNVLGDGVAGRWFVDAYAGSGAVGIEAWSRGARPVIWIESAPPAARALRANLAALGLDRHPAAIVWQRDVVASLAAAERRLPFEAGGCLFLDPPYADSREYQRVFAALDRSQRLLRPGTLIVAESRRGAPLPSRCGRLCLERIYPHGDSQLAFYSVAATPDTDFSPAVKAVNPISAPTALDGGCNLPGHGVSK